MKYIKIGRTLDWILFCVVSRFHTWLWNRSRPSYDMSNTIYLSVVGFEESLAL
jgi:hypothetical protein